MGGDGEPREDNSLRYMEEANGEAEWEEGQNPHENDLKEIFGTAPCSDPTSGRRSESPASFFPTHLPSHTDCLWRVTFIAITLQRHP